MSEYQYYEFRAIDRLLTTAEQAEVAKYSSRARPTASQISFTYHYGDFRGDPLALLEKYYDVYFYIANWGSVTLAFRLPADLVDSAAFKPYCVDRCVDLKEAGDYVIVELSLAPEEGGFGWIEGEGLIDKVLPLRAALLAGDLRVLYLAWLRALMDYDASWDNEPMSEPPIPAGLGKLDAAHKAFVELFEIDKWLLAAAAVRSPEQQPAATPDITGAVAKLSAEEQRTWLVRLAEGEQHLSARFQQRLRAFYVTRPTTTPGGRQGEELLAEAKRRHAAAEAIARRKAEADRVRRLQELAGRETQVWQSVNAQIERKLPAAYDEAMVLLRQLRELAEYQDRLPQFQARIEELRTAYPKRPALQERLSKLL